MRKIRVIILILLTGMVLQACSARGAGPKPSMSMHEAQTEYQRGNYAVALEQLTLIGMRGNPEAQYAVGYMYYYGEGVERNLDIARGWFRDAASRGHGKAQEALQLIDDLRFST